MQLKKENIPFTMIANEVLTDKNLSMKAKGLYAYLFSKPDGWEFSSNRMVTENKDGRESIMTSLKELEKNGYLERERLSTGKMEYTLKHSNKSPSRENPLRAKESPSRENPLRAKESPKSGKPTVAKSLRGKSSPISNTDNTSNTEYAAQSAAQTSNKRKDDTTPFTFEEYLKAMRESNQRHIKLIAEYADQIKPDFQTKGQWAVFTSRHLRPARDLSPFTDDQITSAMDRLEKDIKTPKNPKGFLTKWTLETLLGYITNNHA